MPPKRPHSPGVKASRIARSRAVWRPTAHPPRSRRTNSPGVTGNRPARTALPPRDWSRRTQQPGDRARPSKGHDRCGTVPGSHRTSLAGRHPGFRWSKRQPTGEPGSGQASTTAYESGSTAGRGARRGLKARPRDPSERWRQLARLVFTAVPEPVLGHRGQRWVGRRAGGHDTELEVERGAATTVAIVHGRLQAPGARRFDALGLGLGHGTRRPRVNSQTSGNASSKSTIAPLGPRTTVR